MKKNEEPEPTEKKRGAGAEKKFASSPALHLAIEPCCYEQKFKYTNKQENLKLKTSAPRIVGRSAS